MRIGILIVLMVCGLSGTGVSGAQAPLRIAAAADLEPVLPGILDAFHKETGITTQATYQSSAALTSQIENGAPFDVFLSADLNFPQRLLDARVADIKGFANDFHPLTYARGTLVLWSRNDGPVAHPSLDSLRSSALKRLAIANPERAPYGRAAVAAIASLKLTALLKPKLVTAENIAQAAQFAESGNADAGLISLTAAKTQHLASIGSYLIVPRDLYPPIEQGAVIVSRTVQRESARKLLEFLLSATAQEKFAQGGLTAVKRGLTPVK